MAIYHCSASTIGRAAGRSVVAAAAYISASKITDAKTGVTYDFTRKGGVLWSQIVTPADSPEWASQRAELWNRADLAEDKSTRRATATTGREFRIALPHELDCDAQVLAVREFVLYLVQTYGVAADFSIHEPDSEGDERNFHAHILTSDRSIRSTGFTDKIRVLNVANGGRAAITVIRAQWADIANRHLELTGVQSRVDHRSNAARGIDEAASVHLGPEASGMERRGEASDRGDINRTVQSENALRNRLKAQSASLAEEMEAEDLALKKRAYDEKQSVMTAENDAPELAKARPLTDDELIRRIKAQTAAKEQQDREFGTDRPKPGRSR